MEMQAATTGAVEGGARAREAYVAQRAMNGGRVERLKIALEALGALLRDPDDTQQVFLMYLAMNAGYFPSFLARFAADPSGAELLRDRPGIDSKQVDYPALRALPDGTLGREYVRFLDANKLDPDLFQPPPGLPAVPAYLVQRMRQTHDLWHVLTGYTPDVPGEVALQAFTFAQVRTPGPALLVLAGTLRWSLRHPTLALDSWRGFRRGRDADFLAPVRWEELWALPLEQVRAKLHLAMN